MSSLEWRGRHLDFDLPKDRIAVQPARPRDASRLLVVDRRTGASADTRFRSLASHLEPGDVLVLNNARVINARLFGILDRTGRQIEILFANPVRADVWEVMLRPGKRVRAADSIVVSEGATLIVGARRGHGLHEVRLAGPAYSSVAALLEAEGALPLPPYLGRPAGPQDAEDYQTVFGSRPGAIAAPTAGLHFTQRVFDSLRDRGIQIVELTMHVGIATFTPVRTEDPASHVLKPERYELSLATAIALNEARSKGHRIIAVGTTTTRTLEHVVLTHGRFVEGQGETDLYILPGFQFRAIDGLLTNFHLPRSTLILLVAAFASPERVLDAYAHAVSAGYRFYSYGDCCLFL